MQISQSFNVFFFITIVLPQYFYQRFINTLAGTILHICITLIFRLSTRCLYNIFDIYTSEYCKRNSAVLVTTTLYWGYKYYSTFQEVLFLKVYPTLKAFVSTILLYIVKIYCSVFSWCTDIIKKYKNKLFSTIRAIIEDRVVLKTQMIINYDKLLHQNFHGTIIAILYIISICETYNKMNIFSIQTEGLNFKSDLFILTNKTNGQLLLRTMHILNFILNIINKLS